MKILLLDNHDSFTFNLLELLHNNGKVSVNVIKSDELRLADAGLYDKIIFSPGPGLPGEQPAMFDVLREYGERKPVLGIYFGLQAIAMFYGGKLFNLPKVVHGQSRRLEIVGPEHYIFSGIPDGSKAGLYHSWAFALTSLPPCLEIIALSENGIIMGLAHKKYDICGLQFHPESIMTASGQKMMDNWITR
jgi:anthranilate synthase component 2